MFIDHRPQKLLHAIAYFLGNTRHCHTLKLFKLLNFLDFEHYRQTGSSVTGLDYHAYKMGPVPPKLYEDIQREDAGELVGLTVKETFGDITNELVKRDFKTKIKFDSEWFSPRELEIMERLTFIFKDAKSETMSEYSHDPKLPWKKVYGKGEGSGRLIPYELALHAAPFCDDVPSIDEEEIQMLNELFAGTGLR